MSKWMTATNENRTISVSELGVPDEAIISRLSPDDIRRILVAKVHRGCVIGHTLSAIGFISFILVFLFYRNTPLIIGTIVWFIFFRVFAMLSYQKMILAHRISAEPRLVYWAHPCRPLIRSRIFRYYEIFLTLHSRSGQSLEVPMSRQEAINVISWLKRLNPDIRIGLYDSAP
jgi:hypothetical protein